MKLTKKSNFNYYRVSCLYQVAEKNINLRSIVLIICLFFSETKVKDM